MRLFIILEYVPGDGEGTPERWYRKCPEMFGSWVDARRWIDKVIVPGVGGGRYSIVMIEGCAY